MGKPAGQASLEATKEDTKFYAPVDMTEAVTDQDGFENSEQDNSDNRPDSEGKVYERSKDKWEVIDNCLEGTKKMRELVYPANSESIYLRMNPMEESDEFKRRVDQSTMTQFLGDTLDEYTGLAFLKEPAYSGENQEIVDFLEDVTLQRDDAGTFARTFFRSTAQYGLSFILVDAPSDTANLQSKEEFDKLNPSAYFVQILPKDILSFRVEFRAGKPNLRQVVIREKVNRPKGAFGEEEVDQYRVLRPGYVEIWRKSDKGVLMVEEEFFTSLDYIPLYPAYSDQEHGYFEAEPPFLEMAYAQIKDYQLLSNYEMGAEMVAFPPLFMSGMDEQSKKSTNKAFGANRGIAINEEGKAFYPELNGKGIDAFQWRIENNRKRIAEVGQSFNLESPRQIKTATGEMLDMKLRSSKMVFTIKSCEDAFNAALETVAQMNNIESFNLEQDKVTFFKDFNNLPNAQAAEQRLKRYVAGAIDLKTLLRGDIRDEIIPEDTNIDELILELNGFGEDEPNEEENDEQE